MRRADPRRADRRLPEPEEAGRVRRRGRQIVTHEGYGAVMEKGSKLKPFVDKAIKALTGERDDRPAAEEVAAVHQGADPD